MALFPVLFSGNLHYILNVRACKEERQQIFLAAGDALLKKGIIDTKRTHPYTHTKTCLHHTHILRTCGNVPDQQGCICGEGKAMTSAAVQDRVPGDLQRQLGLEVLIRQTVGAL